MPPLAFSAAQTPLYATGHMATKHILQLEGSQDKMEDLYMAVKWVSL